MSITNVEIKASCPDLSAARKIITGLNANYIGLDHQIDHYFKTRRGRLKLRWGTIEKSLIFYRRPNQKGPKISQIKLYRTEQPEILNDLLAAALEPLISVDKQREIYFINNVKIHLDNVHLLGTFIEIEAIDQDGQFTEAELYTQCQSLMTKLNIPEDNLIRESYSDMLLNMKSKV